MAGFCQRRFTNGGHHSVVPLVPKMRLRVMAEAASTQITSAALLLCRPILESHRSVTDRLSGGCKVMGAVACSARSNSCPAPGLCAAPRDRRN